MSDSIEFFKFMYKSYWDLRVIVVASIIFFIVGAIGIAILVNRRNS
jgi:preprotein translocase subunit Sss1